MKASDQPALAQLPTEARNPASEHLDEVSTLQMLEIINDEDAKVAAAVRGELPNIARAVDQIASLFQRGGRLFYIGAGTSGRLGVLDASECPPTFSVGSGRKECNRIKVKLRKCKDNNDCSTTKQ